MSFPLLPTLHPHKQQLPLLQFCTSRPKPFLSGFNSAPPTAQNPHYFLRTGSSRRTFVKTSTTTRMTTWHLVSVDGHKGPPVPQRAGASKWQYGLFHAFNSGRAVSKIDSLNFRPWIKYGRMCGGGGRAWWERSHAQRRKWRELVLYTKSSSGGY